MASNISNMLGAANYSYLFNNSATQKTNSINSLWQNYGSFNQNAANSLGMLQEINQNRAAVIDSYNEAKDTFYTEFDSNMNALKKSAAAVRNFDFSNVGEDPITKTAVLDKEGNEVTDKNGETVMKTTYSKGMQSALDAVTSLVDNYNDSLNFLKENSTMLLTI